MRTRGRSLREGLENVLYMNMCSKSSQEQGKKVAEICTHHHCHVLVEAVSRDGIFLIVGSNEHYQGRHNVCNAFVRWKVAVICSEEKKRWKIVTLEWNVA